ncbi:MAG: GNAT family N-acetyltransferase [Rhizomicrobium sp.]
MSDPVFRYATGADLPAIVALLSDDEYAENREIGGSEVAPEYEKAFAAMQAMPGNRMLLAELDGTIVAALQLTFIPGLSRRGATRAIVESVRVASDARDRGIGTAIMKHAIAQARAAGCSLVQLTSDSRRTRAHLFYRRLGFQQSHAGFKKELT